MKIISWNVNGLRAVLKKGFLDFLNSPYDVFAIQETKIHKEQIPKEIEDLDFYKYFAFAERKGYSGVAVFSRIKPLEVKIGFNKKFDDEGRVIGLKFDKFWLYNVYFPNGKMSEERLEYKLAFYEEFLEHVLKIMKKDYVIITGDFNTAHKPIDLAHPKANEKYSGFLPIEREWLDKYLKYFDDAFRLFHKEPGAYTWWSYKFNARAKNVGWRIDYFYVDKRISNKINDCSILSNIYGSDHCPILLDIF